MPNHDWTQFHLRIPIKARAKAIYDAWTSQRGLESWFLRKAAFTTKNGVARDPDCTIDIDDTYEWLWHGWSDEMVERGTILQINGKDSLSFGFGKAGNVKINIDKENDETLIELTQYDIPTDEASQVNFYLGCNNGWLFYLTNLKSILEGGIDLRNRKEELKNVINS